jgi:hypothetical protein
MTVSSSKVILRGQLISTGLANFADPPPAYIEVEDPNASDGRAVFDNEELRLGLLRSLVLYLVKSGQEKGSH